MIKAKESQGLFDYSCKQTHESVNGKFMIRKKHTSNCRNKFLDIFHYEKVTSAKFKTLNEHISK